MRHLKTRHALATVAAIAAALVACGGGGPEPATLVLMGGRVHTMDGGRSVTSAIAVRKNQIVAVGSDSQIGDYIGPRTEVIELRGRMVLPGFIDAHIHSVLGSEVLGKCTVDGLPLAVEQIITKVQACLDNADPKEPSGPNDWFEVVNVNPAGLELTRQDLDRVKTDRPLLLRGGDYHTAWLNTKGVDKAHLATDMADPELGSNIRRDANGVPSGFVTYSLAIQRFIDPDVPPLTVEQRLTRAQLAIRQHNSLGITSIQDALTRPDVMEVYETLEAQGKLSMRVRASLASSVSDSQAEVDRLRAIRTKFESGHARVRADSVKILADGVLEYPNQTAAVLTPYRDAQGQLTTNAGTLSHAPATLGSFVTMLDAAGFSVHVHAIGDKAARVSIDAFESARRVNGATDNRHQLAHLQLVQPDDIRRLADVGLIANMQLLWAQPDEYTIEAVQPFIDPAVMPYMYPAGSLRRAGAMLVGGSDWPVSSENPLWAIRTGILRTNPFAPERGVLNANERVSVDDMISAYTVNAAKALRQEKTTGSLEVGKLADLIVVDRDLTTIDPADIGNATVQVTILDGVKVYDGPTANTPQRASGSDRGLATTLHVGRRGNHSDHGH